ncbi:hypothetical protein ABT294_27325 [Nonomuraea sp. NPDC000554]|uniref:hypothetical protein n=1 Tax=Nonomuraea sp. NPDC000554 TaxID=3154259 RepID=UPI003317C9A0
MDPDVLGYYQRGGELTRSREGRGRLEFWRTQDVLRRVLPPTPARVLDDGERRELLLAAARRLESVPSLLGVSGHLLAVTHA